MGFSKDERESLHSTIIAVQCLSISACLFVVFLYIWLKDLRHFTFKLVIYLIIADILKGCALLLPSEDEVLCVVQGILTVYFQLSSILWVAVISYVMHSVIVNRDLAIDRKERRFLLICNFVPLVASVVPLSFEKYGYSEGWCSIEETGSDYVFETILRTVVFYGPLCGVFAYSIYTYHKVNKEVRKYSVRTSSEGSFNSAQSTLYKLYMYPVVLVVSYSVVMIYRAYNFITMGESVYVLALLSIALISLNGFLNALVYGLNKHVRQALRDKCRRNVSNEHSLSFLSLDSDEIPISEVDAST